MRMAESSAQQRSRLRRGGAAWLAGAALGLAMQLAVAQDHATSPQHGDGAAAHGAPQGTAAHPE